MSLEDAIYIVKTNGICSDELWPYDANKVDQSPPTECDNDAKTRSSVQFKRVYQKLEDMKNCISNDLPIIFGFDIYEPFESLSDTFILSIPKGDEIYLGGHTGLIVGYDDSTRLFKVRNNQGKDWGDGGHLYIPYEYMTNPILCSNFWVLSTTNDIGGKTWAEKVKSSEKK